MFLLSRNQLGEAIVHLRKAAALAPNSADVHSNLGGALVNAGMREEGLRHIRRALELRPDHDVGAPEPRDPRAAWQALTRKKTGGRSAHPLLDRPRRVL